jgi:hypothetical protein
VTDVIDDVGTITATWTDPTGTVWPLSDISDDVGWFTTPGPGGWNATTYEIVTDPLPRGGEQVRFIRAKPGSITWPIYIWGETHLEYVQRLRQIKKAFTMTLHRGLPGTLTVARPDGSARTIKAYYSAGLEGQGGEGHLFSHEAITLYCPDGYWQDTSSITETRSYIPGSDFLSPFPTISNSLALGETTITNPGDVQAWPYWTVTGPMSALTGTNVTMGYEFTLTYGLNAGEQVTITTDRPQVRGPAGQNLVSNLDWPTAYLWGLQPGDNDVIFNLSGSAVGSQIQLSFKPRYEGA